MNNKYILFFLVILLMYINIFVPLSDKNREFMKKIISTKKSIQKDKLYIQNKEKIDRDLNTSNNANSIYIKEHFFQEENSKIFNTMQKEIKQLISDQNIKEDNIKWGESYKIDTLFEFPISVRVYGGVESLGKFFDSLYKNKKIHIKSFIFRRTKKFYILELSLYGLKRV